MKELVNECCEALSSDQVAKRRVTRSLNRLDYKKRRQCRFGASAIERGNHGQRK
jgi:hypothetical protein